jgi:hypothetical protein
LSVTCKSSGSTAFSARPIAESSLKTRRKTVSAGIFNAKKQRIVSDIWQKPLDSFSQILLVQTEQLIGVDISWRANCSGSHP